MAKITLEKLQHIYDLHAGDFVLSGNKNTQQLKKLRQAIETHLSESTTTSITGHYRGEEAELHFNAHTQNVVVTDRDGYVVAAYKAGPAQASYILSTGRLS